MFRNMEISIGLMTKHIKLQLSFLSTSISYIRCVLQGPGNNRGQECQII